MSTHALGLCSEGTCTVHPLHPRKTCSVMLAATPSGMSAAREELSLPAMVPRNFFPDAGLGEGMKLIVWPALGEGGHAVHSVTSGKAGLCVVWKVDMATRCPHILV